MKIRMNEHYQGRGHPTLTINQEYESAEIGQELTQWLLDNGKAIDITPKHYGAQPEPELKHDDEIYEEVKQEADATDAARKLAEKNGVDLADVEGTGSGGRVILSDVEAYLEGVE
jgi:pyruvate/2-oxoglutarate dehydrogenase complex dihydrolipoamide acyltransferase (E2) component